MSDKFSRTFFSAVFSLGVSSFLLGCACEPLVQVGDILERYDHNRTRAILVPKEAAAGQERRVIVTQRVYSATSATPFYLAEMSRSPAPDGYAAAIVVPLFTGVPLPLATEVEPGGPAWSDYDDLVDYLAVPNGGVPAESEPSALGGDTSEIRLRYAPMLDFISHSDIDIARIDETAKRFALKILHRPAIRDARFHADFFGDEVALHCADFWFLFSRAPKRELYTRLTVVPYRSTSQDQERKNVNAKTGACQ